MISNELAIFWVSLLLLGYTYVGYPLLMWARASTKPKPPAPKRCEPMVCVILVAYNEAPRIGARIENLLALDYPRDRLKIVIASDGSTDDTALKARQFEDAGVRVIAFERRRGKPAVLNELIQKTRAEIVVLADARQRYEKGALRALVGHFHDRCVGAVSGELIFTEDPDGSTVGEGVGLYWRYEKLIRRNESRVHSMVGATGAIYAIRRELFAPIPEDTILDDVLIPMKIACRGYRALFEPTARAYDRVARSAGEEFTRKVRTVAGNFQLIDREWWLLSPFRNRLWFQTLSHKGLRLLTPFLLAAVLVANLSLLDSSFYRWALGGQIAFYGAALGGYRVRNSRRKSPLLSFPYVFCLLGWATVVAFARFLGGHQGVTWEKAEETHAIDAPGRSRAEPARSREAA